MGPQNSNRFFFPRLPNQSKNWKFLGSKQLIIIMYLLWRTQRNWMINVELILTFCIIIKICCFMVYRLKNYSINSFSSFFFWGFGILFFGIDFLFQKDYEIKQVLRSWFDTIDPKPSVLKAVNQ